MRKLILGILLLLIGNSGFSQTSAPITVNASAGSTLSVIAESSSGIHLMGKTSHIYFYEEARETFIKFLDANLTLLDSVSTLDLINSTPTKILYYEPTPFSSIKSSVIMRKPEPMILLSFRNQGAYCWSTMTKENLSELKKAFVAVYDINKSLLNNRLTLQKYVVEAEKNFTKK